MREIDFSKTYEYMKNNETCLLRYVIKKLVEIKYINSYGLFFECAYTNSTLSVVKKKAIIN